MKYTVSVEIDRSVQEVWDFFDNPDNMGKWLTGFKRFEHVSGEAGQAGAMARHHYEEHGRKMIFVEQIFECVPKEKFANKLMSPSLDMYLTNYFTKKATDKTLLETVVKIKFMNLPMRLMAFFMKRGMIQRQEGDFQRLKAAIENI